MNFAKLLMVINLGGLLPLQALSPPTQVRAYDTPNDGGGSITVKWKLSPDDSLLRGYEILRLEGSPKAEPVSCGFVLRGTNQYQDTEVKDGRGYFYFVRKERSL